MNEIIMKLKGVKGSGTQYTALCPAHDDKNPSLAVSVKDGKILLHCHAGCSTENIVAAIGLEMKDLFADERPAYTNGNGKPNREIAAVYDYKDLNGNIVHSTIRYNPKGFCQRRPDPNNPAGHIYKDVFKDITPVLYNLQAVTRAIKDKKPVIVVEGEKDCESLAHLGFTATTCAMGAGKWRKHYSDMLKGGTVYIIADHDEAGANHAQSVAKSLAGKAEAVYMVDLTAALPETMTEIPGGYDISDLLNATPQEKRAAVVADLIANAPQYRTESCTESNDGGSNGKKSPAEQLLEIVETSGTNFFHSDIKELYAAIPVDKHVEVLPIDSRDFELWLNGLFYKNTTKPINKDGVKQVQAVLSAKALYDNPSPVKLSTRIAAHEGVFWYDLANVQWQAIKISADGWEAIDNPPILFSRYRHQIPQIIPKKGGNINKIMDYVNLKENKTLFLCWSVSCFVPNIPHAAIIISGEKGAAKSTASGLLKSLIDPSALETLTLQNDQRTLAVNLQHHWLLPFDNVSFINEEVSDTLCRAITGGGIQQRKLHTNSEDTIFTFQRCVIINGIHNVATRADLLDRSILIELLRITDTERKELSEIMANFETDKHDILGGIFDTLVIAMSLFPLVKLQNLPRMADFARWGYAIGEALGANLGQVFLDEYQQNYERQNDEVLNNNPVAMLVLEFMKDKTDWYGTHSALYDKFVELADTCAINSKDKKFPKDAAALSRQLRNIMSNLRHEGIIYIPEKRKKYGVPLTLKKENEPTPPTPSYTQTPQAAENQGFMGVGSDVGMGVGQTTETEPTPYHTPEPTPEKPANNQGFKGKNARVYDGVGKNELFVDWYSIDVSDEEIPPEFLKPTPIFQPQQKELMEQMALV
jgi:5S rRNA maturation endonuclease (ribonuclease M5)